MLAWLLEGIDAYSHSVFGEAAYMGSSDFSHNLMSGEEGKSLCAASWLTVAC